MSEFIRKNQKNISRFILVMNMLFMLGGLAVSALPFLDMPLKAGLVCLLVYIPLILNVTDYWIAKRIAKYTYKDMGLNLLVLLLIQGPLLFVFLGILPDPAAPIILAIISLLLTMRHTHQNREEVFNWDRPRGRVSGRSVTAPLLPPRIRPIAQQAQTPGGPVAGIVPTAAAVVAGGTFTSSATRGGVVAQDPDPGAIIPAPSVPTSVPVGHSLALALASHGITGAQGPRNQSRYQLPERDDDGELAEYEEIFDQEAVDPRNRSG